MATQQEAVQATLDNLDAAEALLGTVLEQAQASAEHLHSLGKGQRVDQVKVAENGQRLLKCLEELHDRLAKEVPALVKYIPFERSSYGAKKDAEIAAESLAFAQGYLRDTLDAATGQAPVAMEEDNTAATN